MTLDFLQLTPEFLAIASVAMGAIAAVFAFFAFYNSLSGGDKPLGQLAALQMMRQETDALKAAGDERERRLLKKLDTDFAHVEIEAKNHREGLRRLIEEKLEEAATKQGAAAREMREEIGGNFKAIGSNIAATLDQSGVQHRERLEDLRKSFAGNSDQQRQAQEALRLAVEGRLDAIRQESAEKFEEMRQTVDEKLQSTLETRLDQSFTRIVEQLSKVYDQIGEMKTLASNVGILNNVLSNVKVRGTFGEVQLAAIIEEFLAPEQYIKHAQLKDGSAERAEYAIKFKVGPAGDTLLLPVDAKFPREDYDTLIEAFETGDAKFVEECRKQLESRIKLAAKEIGEKFINPPRTTDFAILFLPTESLYAEALRQPGLFEYLQRECHVTLAGPTTFSAILNAFRMNFHSLALARQTSEIWRVLSAVRTEFGRYNRVVGSLDRQLRAASSSVEKLSQRARAVDHKLQTVEILGDDGTAQRLLGLDDEIEIDGDAEFANGHAPSKSSGDKLAQAAE